MTHKQRFLAAMRLQTPDEVPVAPLIHCRYADKVLGRSDWRAVFEVHQMIGSCHHRGPLGVGVQCKALPDGYGSEHQTIEELPDGRTTTRWTILTPKRTMTGTLVTGAIPHDPLVGKTTEYPVKDEADWRAYLDYREQVIACLGEPELNQITEAVAVMGEDGMPSVGLCPGYTTLGSVRGMQELIMDMHDCPDLLDELFAVERQITRKSVGAFIAAPTEVAWLDICWATGSNLGPRLFERWALPDVVDAVETVRSSGVDLNDKILGLYTLGRMKELMPMLADAGVRFVGSFEPNEGDISIADAKRLYGNRLCVMGNFNCLVLSFGTVEDARKEAMRCLREGMGDGGYIMVSADEVPADTKMDNLKAWVETVHEHGRYAG